ncbi:MAG: formylglycine-generating enzyme family protein, partial [Anaerolineae bacterium]
VLCPGCAEDGGDLLVMKYPVTNAQYAHFVAANGYHNPAYWGGEASESWQWRVKNHSNYRGDGPVKNPEYWQDARLGEERGGFPVVGVSWYEAQAYAAWLAGLVGNAESVEAAERVLIEKLLPYQISEIRLPTEAEWEKIAGGTKAADRYPWDAPAGPATGDVKDIVVRANVRKADLNGTSPAGMYPLGRSEPYGLMDLAGNVWEWMENGYDDDKVGRALRGGSWNHNRWLARVSYRNYYYPLNSNYLIGFRLVAPVAGS